MKHLTKLAAIPLMMALFVPAAFADEAPPSENPADYLLFETGDIPADGIPALDGETVLDHGWVPPPGVSASNPHVPAYYRSTPRSQTLTSRA